MGYDRHIYQKASELLDVIQVFDIVEFNRLTYSHFALYIGSGICVHVTSDEKDTELTSANKVAQHILKIAGSHLVRVNNFKITCFFGDIFQRPDHEILEFALCGLTKIDKDKSYSSTNVVLNVSISVKYELISFNNCEGYATYWKYRSKSGWSNQAGVPIFQPLATLDRLNDHAIAGYREMFHHGPPIVKPIAIAAMIPLAGVKVVTAAGEALTSAASGILQKLFP